VNPANGLPITARAVRPAEIFPGPESGNLPDLVFTWNAEAKVGREIESPALGRLSAPAPYESAPYYAGNHRPNAFVIARGPGIAPRTSLGEEHLVGLAPTILGLLGCDAPPYMDGKPWPELLRGAD
jgi:hypothetical protein